MQHNIWTFVNNPEKSKNNCERAISDNNQKEAAEGPAPGPSSMQLVLPVPLNFGASDLFMEYKVWKDSYSFFKVASGTIHAQDLVRGTTLLHCIGTPMQRIFANLLGDKDTFAQAVAVQDAYFTPWSHVVLVNTRSDRELSALKHPLKSQWTLS